MLREEGIGLFPLEFCLPHPPPQGKCPKELLMTRHFFILTAVCEMLMDFLANKTGQDPPLSITLLKLFPQLQFRRLLEKFIKELFIRNLLIGDHVGHVGH